jgi:hypothetical protein
VLKLVHAVVVAMLAVSASGVSTIVIGEPCTGFEEQAVDDGACPPTCVTCGCCAQAADTAPPAVTRSVETPVADFTPFLRFLPPTSPRDILHVPKSRLV